MNSSWDWCLTFYLFIGKHGSSKWAQCQQRANGPLAEGSNPFPYITESKYLFISSELMAFV